MDLYLYVADESIKSPYISRSFKDEIIFEIFYLEHKKFLSEAEIKFVAPNPLGEITIGEKKPFKEADKQKFLNKITKIITGKGNIGSVDELFDEYLITSEKVEDRERDPKQLKTALQKIQNYLIQNASRFPVVHSVYETKALKEEVGYVMIDNVKGHLEGNLFHHDNYENLRDKIHVKSYLEDFGKLSFFVEVQPEIQINNTTYFTKTITKAQQFEKEFTACFDFLDQAIKANKKVLWEHG